jgi:hypothetical protein
MVQNLPWTTGQFLAAYWWKTYFLFTRNGHFTLSLKGCLVCPSQLLQDPFNTIFLLFSHQHLELPRSHFLPGFLKNFYRRPYFSLIILSYRYSNVDILCGILSSSTKVCKLQFVAVTLRIIYFVTVNMWSPRICRWVVLYMFIDVSENVSLIFFKS